jgi:hypothetical protein
MRFTGKNLELVREGLELALAELHNQIATCPDVIEYGEDIEQLQAKEKVYQALLAKVDKERFKTCRVTWTGTRGRNDLPTVE